MYMPPSRGYIPPLLYVVVSPVWVYPPWVYPCHPLTFRSLLWWLKEGRKNDREAQAPIPVAPRCRTESFENRGYLGYLGKLGYLGPPRGYLAR